MTRARDLADFNLDGKAVIINESSADLDFRVESNGNANMLVVDGGNNRVGIGTNSPGVPLEVNGDMKTNVSGSNAQISAITDGASNYATMSVTTGARSYSMQVRPDQSNAFTIRDETGGTNPLRIFTSGNSSHSANNAGVVSTFENTNTSNPDGIDVAFTGAAPDNNSRYFYRGRDNAVNRYYVYSDGDVQNHDNSYSGTSDSKLKQQVTDAASQWDDIKALQVRKFKFNSDVTQHGDSDALWRLGVVAQEVEAAGMTGLIKNNPDYGPDQFDEETQEWVAGEELGTVTKAVKYSILYMKAVKALQEAMTRIETLETEMTALKARVTTLEEA